MTRVAIAGGTGLIGRALTRSLVNDGVEVVVLTRDPSRPAASMPVGARLEGWNPADAGGAPALARLIDGADAVVNLCGVPVGPLPWTPARRRRIVDSRVVSSSRLVDAMGQLEPPRRPGAFVCASGTDGYTGIDADPATEATDTSRATGFLADVGRAWESGAAAAAPLGVRTVMIRTSFVLARESSLLRVLALPFRLGLGGRYGDGAQWLSWIHLDDLVSAYRVAIADPRLSGPINAASPEPCRQRDLAAALGRVLRRPNWFPMPAWLLRLILGEQATLLLGSRRVLPARLLEVGFSFRWTELGDALRDSLGGSAAPPEVADLRRDSHA